MKREPSSVYSWTALLGPQEPVPLFKSQWVTGSNVETLIPDLVQYRRWKEEEVFVIMHKKKNSLFNKVCKINGNRTLESEKLSTDENDTPKVDKSLSVAFHLTRDMCLRMKIDGPLFFLCFATIQRGWQTVLTCFKAKHLAALLETL